MSGPPPLGARPAGCPLLGCLLLGCLLLPPTPADAVPRQQAVGAVNAGKLLNPSRLRASRHIRLRFPKNAWGTRRLVDLIERCARLVRRRHRSAHKLLIGDLSRRHGGRLRPHSGHQNGREADVGFYMRSGKPLGGLWRVGGGDIDARRTLSWVRCLIDSGEVLHIFLDRRLQIPLHREARRQKWSAARLRRTFSYPRRASRRAGIIQHRRGHRNHMHVRLRCAPHERACRDAPATGAGRGAKRRHPRRR